MQTPALFINIWKKYAQFTINSQSNLQMHGNGGMQVFIQVTLRLSCWKPREDYEILWDYLQRSR